MFKVIYIVSILLPKELNDGVHWRLTLPACNLPENSDEQSDLAVVPRCSQLLHMKFDLLFAPFKVEDPAGPKVDLIREVHKLIPDDPIFSIVATQNIIIENASSGIHSYYPVRCCLLLFFEQFPTNFSSLKLLRTTNHRFTSMDRTLWSWTA